MGGGDKIVCCLYIDFIERGSLNWALFYLSFSIPLLFLICLVLWFDQLNNVNTKYYFTSQINCYFILFIGDYKIPTLQK